MGSDKPDYTLGISILEQALANLTAVVSATALDIRALDEDDIPHEPLPYDYVALNWGLAASVNDGANDDGSFAAANWGVGKDFYPVTLTFSFGWANIYASNIFVNRNQGVKIEVFEALAGAGTDPVILRENISPVTHPLILIGSGYYTVGTFLLNKNKIDVGNTLIIRVSNESGGNLLTGAIDIHIMGVAV